MWRTPPSARYFVPSRGGRRSPTCCRGRGCCTWCRSPRRWPTCCCGRCSRTCRKMSCAVSRRARCCRSRDLASAVAAGDELDPGGDRRGFGLVALRPDPRRGAGGAAAGVGQRHVYSGGAAARRTWPMRAWCGRHWSRGFAWRLPREDYEADWQGRFTLADLNDHGRRALGMLP